ncbi:DEAD/DEAH box helicase [Jeotgalibacillus soli]|nr:DEAD/DEAH box helicase family protein [Jeotgalibacillus soli]
MGKASSCTPIVLWCGPEAPLSLPTEPILSWEGTLSKPQHEASMNLVAAIKNKTSLLIWAVCGAGKTEMLFSGIEYALSKRLRVCIATPRTDVVLELVPRLKQAFSSSTVAGLYGGSEDRFGSAMITISTTHQLYRYRHAFDVMIVDEVDAFPYSMDESLQKAVEHSRKKDATLIYLSATPNKSIQAAAKRGELPMVAISARYHAHPLPEPVPKWIGNWKKSIDRKRIPIPLQKWIIHRLTNQIPILVFVPNIPYMERLEKLLSTSTTAKIAAVHAEDPGRKERVQQMRDNQLALLLTTTILERGVTFKGVEVAVLGAEEEIFTESALVQIAGRAGRNKDFPKGNVTFFHHGYTKAILEAQAHIRQMNLDAKKKGWLLTAKKGT